MPSWPKALYAAMERNSSHVDDLQRRPADATVELGLQVEISDESIILDGVIPSDRPKAR